MSIQDSSVIVALYTICAELGTNGLEVKIQKEFMALSPSSSIPSTGQHRERIHYLKQSRTWCNLKEIATFPSRLRCLIWGKRISLNEIGWSRFLI